MPALSVVTIATTRRYTRPTNTDPLVGIRRYDPAEFYADRMAPLAATPNTSRHASFFTARILTY